MSVPGIRIITASYGTGTSTVDVTEKLTKMLTPDGKLNVTVSAQNLGILDPAPGVQKTLQASVSINGAPPTLLKSDDNETMSIIAPTANADPPENIGFTILSMLFYFLIAIFAGYFSYSSYLLGSQGFKVPGGNPNTLIGVVLAVLVFGLFVMFSAFDVGSGIVGLLVVTPMSVLGLLLLIFLILCYDLNYIDFTYLREAKISEL